MLRSKPAPLRSACPLNAFLEVFGDPWTLLIVRDLLFKSKRTFGEFAAHEEGVATNVLADRLQKLRAHGIVEVEKDPSDARRLLYRLTGVGKDLAPALVEMIVWGARHFRTAAPADEIRRMTSDRSAYITGVLRRLEHGS